MSNELYIHVDTDLLHDIVTELRDFVGEVLGEEISNVAYYSNGGILIETAKGREIVFKNAEELNTGLKRYKQ
jgi:hypothetical protein